MAFSTDDSRLKPLIDSAVANKIHVVVGAPLKTDSAPHIGAFVISPSGCVETYSKMNLHSGEEAFFSAGVIEGAFAEASNVFSNSLKEAVGCLLQAINYTC